MFDGADYGGLIPERPARRCERRWWASLPFRVLAGALGLSLAYGLAQADQQADPRPISWSSCSSSIAAGGTAQNAPLGAQVNPLRGYYLQNPKDATGQGIATAEDLFFDPSGTASTSAGVSPFLQPGQSITIGPGTTFAQPVSVNAATIAHKFVCMVGQ